MMDRVRTGLWLALACLTVTAPAHGQMTLPGKFEVTDTGSASYTIPLSVVPGTAGLEPKLSLQYDSRSGNGLLGVGWSLAGLPAITRCGRTIAQDGQVGGVGYDANDRFCLDGQRLVAISGTYGADQTEYRTERESFSKIISYGQAGSGPSHFKVWTKAGLVMEFGNTADSRIEAQGKASVRVWAINKTQDTKSNYFTVQYIEDSANGEYRPDRIDYTGNVAAGTQPQTSVRFVYETRPDIVPLYQAGSLIRTTQRMTKVQAWQGSSLNKEYIIEYATAAAGESSVLLHGKVCNGGSICLPGLNFEVQATGTLAFAQNANPITPAYLNNGTGIYFGDWNGDGLTDVVWFDRGNGNNYWFVATVSAAGALSFTRYDNPIAPGLLNNAGDLYFGDWNGDGVTDVMRRDASGTNYWFVSSGMVSGALAFSFVENPIAPGGLNNGTAVHFGDWNGDGLTDVMWHDQPSGNNYWYVNAGFSNGSLGFTTFANPILPGHLNNGTAIYFGDYNGDGRSDVMWWDRSNGNNFWYVNNGIAAGTLSFTQMVNPIPVAYMNNGTAIYFGDWNGDGLTDVMWYDRSSGNNQWHVNMGHSVGALSFTTFNNPILPGHLNNGTAIYFGDYNGDGRSDVMWWDRSNGNNFWYINNGIPAGALSFAQVVNPIAVGSMNNGTAIYFGDWNGDGVTDVMWYDRLSGPNYWQVNQKRQMRLLAAQSPSSGTATTIAYQALSQSASGYSRDTGASACAYPCVDVQGPLYVVSEVKSSNGLGGEYRSTYRYAGAKSDQHGRGFLGFRQMVVRDEQTGVEQTTTYRQDYPFTGLVANREKRLGAQMLNRSSNTYNATDLGDTRRYPFLTQSLEESWELSGTALPAVTTSYQYDAYGNATSVSVSTGDGHGKTTTNTYANDTATWLLGRLQRSVVTSTTPGN